MHWLKTGATHNLTYLKGHIMQLQSWLSVILLAMKSCCFIIGCALSVGLGRLESGPGGTESSGAWVRTRSGISYQHRFFMSTMLTRSVFS